MVTTARPRPRGAFRLALLLTVSLGLSDLVRPDRAVAAPAAPSFSVSTAVTGEKVAATGTLPTRVARPVALQREDGGTWRTVDTGRTTARGSYRLSLRAPGADAAFRVLAKAVTVAGKRYPAVTTRSAPLAVVAAQTVVLSGPTSATVGDTGVVDVRVQPGRAGQQVRIERETPDGWTPVSGRVSTSRSGRASIDVTFADPGVQTYRASVTGEPADGALVSAPVDVDVQEPVPVRMTRISSGGGYHAALQMTPDGERVLWQRGDTLSIWRRSTGASTSAGALPIAAASVEDATPDLRFLLLMNGDNTRLALWDRQLGTVTDVVDGTDDPDFTLYNGAHVSDDGSTVVLESRNDLTAAGYPRTINFNVYLWASASPGTLTPVRATEPGEGSSVVAPPRRPTLSGDGQTVFFNAFGNETEAFAEVPEDAQVVRWVRATGASAPIAVPDHAEIFESGLVDVDGTTLVVSTGFGRGVWRPGSYVEVPLPSGPSLESGGAVVSDVTPDGTQLVFTEGLLEGGRDISVLYRWTIGGGAPQLISAGPDGARQVGVGGVLSDDGSRIAFSSPDDPVTGETGDGFRENVFYFDDDAG